MRSKMHAGGLLVHRNVQGVGGVEEEEEEEALFCGGSQEAAVYAAADRVGDHLSLPGRVVCSNAGIVVAKANQLIHLGHSVQFLVEIALCFLGFCPWGEVDADDGGECDSPKRQTTYLTLDGTIYEQVKGTPMGSPISGLIAEAVLQRLESLVFQHHRPKFWARYVVDTFVVIDRDQLLALKEQLNAVFPDI
ncbi:hypothetical protein SprV_0301055600 [Sparganum proliferum]